MEDYLINKVDIRKKSADVSDEIIEKIKDDINRKGLPKYLYAANILGMTVETLDRIFLKKSCTPLSLIKIKQALNL